MMEGVRHERLGSAPAVVAIGLVLLGLIATAARLDAPADGSVLRLGRSTWHSDGVVVDVPGTPSGAALHAGDRVTAIADHKLADGLGGVTQPRLGDRLTYEVVRDGVEQPIVVPMRRPDLDPLLDSGWGNLVFVIALAGLAVALYLRRPEEPATTPLLVLAAGLLGSTLTVVAGLPALALVTGGPAAVAVPSQRRRRLLGGLGCVAGLLARADSGASVAAADGAS